MWYDFVWGVVFYDGFKDFVLWYGDVFLLEYDELGKEFEEDNFD